MSRKIITALLIAALVTIPAPVRSQEKENTVAVCVVLAFGAVVFVSLLYVCKKLPPPPGTCNCGCSSTGCPCGGLGEAQNVLPFHAPSGPIVTNPPSAMQIAGTRLTYNGFTPLGPGSIIDDQGNTWNYGNAFKLSLQSSVDMTNWQTAFDVTGWLTTDSGLLVAVRSNNVTLINAYFSNAVNPTNGLPLDLPGGSKRFYRIACQ